MQMTDGWSLKMQRLQRRVPQWKLAQEMGISPTDVCAIENGRKAFNKKFASFYLESLERLGRKEVPIS